MHNPESVKGNDTHKVFRDFEIQTDHLIVIGALGTIPKGLIKELDDLEIRERVETIQTTELCKIGQNTEKSPGHLKLLAVTQIPVRSLQLMLVWKTLNWGKYLS